MTIVEIFLLALSLCFDTLAVSIAGGTCISNISFRQRIRILLIFGLIQAGFTLLGWILGASIIDYISKFDHWVAFLLLLFIGGKMVRESFDKSEEKGAVDLLNTGQLIISAVATSIDALAVGVSLAMVDMSNSRSFFTFAVIGIVTMIAAATGLRGGAKLAGFIGSKANLVGGLILIAIGTKILIEHLTM